MVGLANEVRSCPTSPAFSESYRTVTIDPANKCCPGTNRDHTSFWALGNTTNILKMPSAPNGTLPFLITVSMLSNSGRLDSLSGRHGQADPRPCSSLGYLFALIFSPRLLVWRSSLAPTRHRPTFCSRFFSPPMGAKQVTELPLYARLQGRSGRFLPPSLASPASWPPPFTQNATGCIAC